MSVRFEGSSGLRLAADVTGCWSGPVVVLLHGGGQTRNAWGAAAAACARAGFFVVTLDQRGHGESAWDPKADYSMTAYAADLQAVLSEIGRPAALVGASLGGLAALLVAGGQPSVPCTALVLVDITPHVHPEGRRRITEFMRGRADGFESLDDAAQAVADFVAPRPRPDDVTGLAKNLRLGEDGRYRWHWDPAFMDAAITSDVDDIDRFETAARSVHAPILLIRGGDSEIVTEAGAHDLLRIAPHAEYVDIAGAGHMVAGDRNDAFTAATINFLQRTVPFTCDHAPEGDATKCSTS